MLLFTFKSHLAHLIIIAIWGAIICAGVLIFVYRCRSRELFKPTRYEGKDPDGFFAKSERTRITIHFVRTAFVGLPACLAGAFFADFGAVLYYNAVDLPNLTHTQLLVKFGLGLLAALVLVVIARGIIRFAEYSDYNNLAAIAGVLAKIGGIAAVSASIAYGVIQLHRYMAMPLIFAGAACFIWLLGGAVFLVWDYLTQDPCGQTRPSYYGRISLYEAELQRRLWDERQRIEREENIRLDVRERRLAIGL